MTEALPFWKRKRLDGLSRAEWESLCDGCGRCCLHKLRDDDTDALAWTDVACRLLDAATCRCTDYPGRQAVVPDCVRLTPRRLAAIDWLPPTCGYRLVAEGRDLPWWHPLVSGDADSVHRAGVSVRGRVVDERAAGALEDHVVAWPGRTPRAARVPPPAIAAPPPRTEGTPRPPAAPAVPPARRHRRTTP